MPPPLIIFNKPFRVLSQFSPQAGKSTLADYLSIPDFYPAGRLDFDSEGLLLLTNQGALQHIIASPDFKLPKTYWVQVEGLITDEALMQLRQGVALKDGLTKPAQADPMPAPEIWPRSPPVRFRANIPTSWVCLIIREGKNRQVRRMTAAVGFPTLRLIRYAIGPYSLENIKPGEYKPIEVSAELAKEVTHFEQQRKRKTPPSDRRRHGEKGPKVPYGKGVARRTTGTKPARRTHRK